MSHFVADWLNSPAGRHFNIGHIPATWQFATAAVNQILSGKYSNDAGHGGGFAGVDAQNFGVGVWATLNSKVGHARNI